MRRFVQRLNWWLRRLAQHRDGCGRPQDSTTPPLVASNGFPVGAVLRNDFALSRQQQSTRLCASSAIAHQP